MAPAAVPLIYVPDPCRAAGTVPRSRQCSAEAADHAARHVIAVFDGVPNRLLSRNNGRDRNADPLNPADQVAPQPFRGLLGQRRDEDLVEVVFTNRVLDRGEWVRAADQMIDRAAGRSAQERDGGFQCPIGRLAVVDVRDQQRERGRLALRTTSDFVQETRVASLCRCKFAAVQAPGGGQSMRLSPPRGSWVRCRRT
jgi:hypothetical protein